MTRITDRTLSCLDGLPLDKPDLSRFLSLLITLDPGAIEMSERMYDFLSPLPEYKSYVLRIDNVDDIIKYPRIKEFVCGNIIVVGDNRIRAEILLNDIGNNDITGNYTDYAAYAKVRVLGMDNTLCGDYPQTFARLREFFRGDIEFCPANRYHCAAALAAEWITSCGGGRGDGNVVTSFGGVGGFAPTEEVMMFLRINNIHHADKVYDFFPEMSDLFAKITKTKIRPNKPIIGKRIFHVESSVHVDGILKQPECYEPFPPETVGLARKIILGKQSGAASIRAKLSELNITYTEDNIPPILEAVRNKAIEKSGAVTDREFVKLANGLTGNSKQAVYTIHNDTQIATKYQTNLICNDTQLTTKRQTNLLHNDTQLAAKHCTDSAKPKRYIVDSTLRDGEQTPGLCFSAEQKLKIAALLDSCGVHQIEAGVPAASRREKEIITKIIGNRKNAVISVWARLAPPDIEHAIDVRPDIIHVCVPVSRMHIYKKLRKDENWVVAQLFNGLALIDKKGIPLSVGFEDAFRADVDFMVSTAKILIDSGVTRIRLSDTVGIASPALCRKILNELSSNLSKTAGFGIHAHNDLGMAVANTLEAAKSGCLYADTTANGTGERAGNCDFAQLIDASGAVFDWGMTAVTAWETQREIGRVIKSNWLAPR